MQIACKGMPRGAEHLVAVVVAVLFAAPAGAQQALPATLRITVDHAAAVSLDASAGAVLIADPAIADIVTERGHLVFVVGKKLGATNLLVYDGAGKRLAEREVIVVPPEPNELTGGAPPTLGGCSLLYSVSAQVTKPPTPCWRPHSAKRAWSDTP